MLKARECLPLSLQLGLVRILGLSSNDVVIFLRCLTRAPSRRTTPAGSMRRVCQLLHAVVPGGWLGGEVHAGLDGPRLDGGEYARPHGRPVDVSGAVLLRAVLLHMFNLSSASRFPFKPHTATRTSTQPPRSTRVSWPAPKYTRRSFVVPSSPKSAVNRSLLARAARPSCRSGSRPRASGCTPTLARTS